MKRITSRVALAAMLTLLPLLAAAQMWSNLPIIGGAAYCAGYSTGTTGQICNVTVPAGPTALTGAETVAVDTNLSQGRSPQTVKASIQTLGAGPTVYTVPETGASITIAAVDRRHVVIPAATIAALTFVTPTATALTAYDNKLLGICTTQIVTTLTLTAGSGTTIANGPTALLVPVATGAGSCVEWVYRKSNTTWYRVQ